MPDLFQATLSVSNHDASFCKHIKDDHFYHHPGDASSSPVPGQPGATSVISDAVEQAEGAKKC